MIPPFLYQKSWGKDDLFEAARQYMTAVLQSWNLPLPVFYKMVPKAAENHYHGSGGMHFGLYNVEILANDSRCPRVYVNVPASSTPVLKSVPRRYSYPGNKSDRTAAGILAHECGHHAWACLMPRRPDLLQIWQMLVRDYRRQAISGYEPTPEEAFAETLRLYALNPMLLKEGAPYRYVFVRRDLGLPAPHEEPWQKILKNAAPSIRQQALSWTQKAKTAKGRRFGSTLFNA